MVMKKDTRLLPYLVEYETVMKNPALSDQEHDLQLSGIMTSMEEQFGVPYLNSAAFNESFPELIELYRKIGDSRVTLGDEDVFQVGKKLHVVDGDQSREAKAFDRKDLGMSVWYMCQDQGGEWGYAFDAKTILWDGSKFVYDCRKYNTPLSEIMGRRHDKLV